MLEKENDKVPANTLACSGFFQGSIRSLFVCCERNNQGNPGEVNGK